METTIISDEQTKPVTPFGTSPDITPPLRQTSLDGLLLKDRYLIEGELGRGGIGVVYLARDTQLLERRVVVKVLLRETDDSALTLWIEKKFEQEIEALVRLDHPGIVGVLDAGAMPDGKPFFVMQFVEGVTLRSLLKDGQGMDFARIARIVRQIGTALGAAHDKGIVHRDLKPENVMVQTSSDGEEIIKLIDFGIASVKDSQFGAAAERTKVAGAAPYMAPEQLRGQPAASSDIWALGVVAYELATGRLPFGAGTMVELYEFHRRGPEFRPSLLRNDLPPAAEAAILKSLAFDPSLRHARARDLSEELVRALTEENPPAQIKPGEVSASQFPSAPTQVEAEVGPPPAPAPESKPSPFPRKAMAVAIVAVALLGAALWFSLSKDEAEQRPDRAPAPQSTTAGSRMLNYSIRVRLNPKKNPNQAPAVLAGEIIFSAGDELCFAINSPQDGYLYIINEGPRPVNGLPRYNVLFPDPRRFSAEAPSLRMNQPLFIPSERPPWFPVDAEQGAEKLWLVWAERPVGEMESVRKWLNDRDGGEIKDEAEIRAVEQFLNQNYSSARPVAEKDEHQTHLKGGQNGLLVYPVKLEHR
ncbi:MAG: protein kinase domain-containing protein [Blastocatellia bacterium]